MATWFLAFVIFLSACASPKKEPPAPATGIKTQPGMSCNITLPTLNLCGFLQWQPDPSPGKSLTVQVTLFTRDTKTVVSLPDLSVTAFIQSQDGSIGPIPIVRKTPSSLLLEQVYFMNSGISQMVIQFRNGSTIVDQGVFTIEL